MSPDIVILNGRLMTFDDARPRAEGLAISGDTIVSVGSEADMRALAGPGTRCIDAGGKTVLPGFIDSHVHLFGGSVELDSLNLHGVCGRSRLSDAIRAYARSRPDDYLLYAAGAEYDALGTGQGVTRRDLDSIIDDRPFAMMAADHHTAWANTAALDAAGILHDQPTLPEGSVIVTGVDGKATGALVEFGAYKPVISLTSTGGREAAGLATGADPEPAPTADQRAVDTDIVRRGLRHCASHGITSLHNMDGNHYQLELLDRLDQQDELCCRVEVPFHLKHFDSLDRLSEAQAMRRSYQSDRLWCNRVKMFMDGVMESYTALMLRSYPDRPDTHGEALFAPEHFNEACRRADALGFQIATHAIGDLAVRRTLDGYEAARIANGVRDARHRVEHIEVVDPNDLPRFSELGVIASMQPLHSPVGGYFEPPASGTLLHESQIPYACAWNELRNAGAHLCFSTDWPVVPVDVMLTLQGAVSPRELDGGWPDAAQTLHQALAAYTRDAAFTEFSECKKGRLKPGMLADVVIMSNDLESIPCNTLAEARAALTLCGGQITYES